MDHIQIKSELIEQLIEISKDAGKAILEVYNTNFGYQIKEDLSPITKADALSNNIICEKLKVITPDIPILSEENSDIPFKIRSKWNEYWLIDPLDGTKEFINRNGEFTVNIALIKDLKPILGIIHIPISNETYWGSANLGSFYLKDDNAKQKISVVENKNSVLRIVTSRSHPSKSLESVLKKNDEYNLINKGSSIKFCLIAHGMADAYIRLGPTSEWDIAAGEAILKFAGGNLKKLDGESVSYNSKESYINPNFIASSSKIVTLDLLERIRKIKLKN